MFDIDLIPSKDMREYIRKTNHSFTDFEQATITYHLKISLNERHKLLSQLAKTTNDSDLKNQILQRLDFDAKNINMFGKNDGFVYAVQSHEYDTPYTCGYFTDIDDAVSKGKLTDFPFSVEKYTLDAKINSDMPVCGFDYDKSGDITYYWTEEAPHDEQIACSDLSRFENAYISLPNPFEKGDIVKITNSNTVGIIETSSNEWLHFDSLAKELNSEWLDASIMVEFFTSEHSLGHDHISPLFLEKTQIDDITPENRLLSAASDLLCGKTTLDFFLNCYNQYRSQF
jgi:hypothetical protein